MSDRIAIIEASLAALEPQQLEVIDESHLHAGHPGARDGRGHFRVRIVSEAFEGQRSLARHRRIYETLGSLMRTDIHALSITALTPTETRDDGTETT